MDEPIDCGDGHHWILEDLFPLRERQIACQQDTGLLVALRDERKEHLDFSFALLHIPYVINDQRVCFSWSCS